MELQLGEPRTSEAKAMANIYAGAFDSDTPKLTQLLYRETNPVRMIEETLRAQLHAFSWDRWFQVVFDDSNGNFYGSSMSKFIFTLIMPHSQSSNLLGEGMLSWIP